MIGVITKIQEKENQVTYEVKGKEKVLVKISSHPNYSLGDKVRVKGTFQIPEKNHTELLFDYQTYLKRKRIFYIVEADSITRIQKNHNILYQIRNILQKRLHENPYLNTFILGDKSYLSKEAMRSFQENGISHLFASNDISYLIILFIISRFFSLYFKRSIILYFISRKSSILFLHPKRTFIFIIIIDFFTDRSLFDLGYWFSILLSD